MCPILIDARVKLAGLWTELVECHAVPPSGVPAIRALWPLLEALEEQPERSDAPSSPLRTPTRANSLQFNRHSFSSLPTGHENDLAIAQVCHCIGWAILTEAIPGFVDMMSCVGEAGDADEHGAAAAGDWESCAEVEARFNRAIELRQDAGRTDLHKL